MFMALKLDYEILFVGRDENSFLENYSCDFTQEYGSKSGQIFANIEIQNNPVDAEIIGVKIFNAMQDVYFENVDMDPYHRFEATLKAINSILSHEKSKKESGYIGGLNMMISAIHNGILYLAQTGEAEAYLIRKRYVSIVSEGLTEEGENGDVFVNIATGTIEENDFVLFSSTRLLRYISKADLAGSIRRGGVAETLMEIKDVISSEMLGRVGLTGITFLSEEEMEIDENMAHSEIMLETREDILNESKVEEELEYSKSKNKFKKKINLAKLGKVKEKIGGIVSGKGESKQKVLMGLVGVIVILIVGILFVNSNNVEKSKLENLDKVLVSVQNKITEAETKMSVDKEAAIAILDKAYSDSLEVLNSGYYRDKANLLLVQIEESRDKLDNVNRISNAAVLVNLKNKDANINPVGFVEVDSKVYVYTDHSIFEIVLDQVQDEMPIDSEETIIAATGFDDRDSIVFLTKSGKLLEYREGTISFMDTVDGTFRKAVALDDWSNRIYMLDDETGQIWKYAYKGTKDQFDAAEEYVGGGDPALIGAKDLAIDSSVYVLGADSTLLKYYGGDNEELVIANAPFNNFDNAMNVYTSDKIDQVLVVDADNSKVFVFEKDLSTGRLDYIAQYLFDDVDSIRDVYMEAGSGKLNVLTGSEVLQIQI